MKANRKFVSADDAVSPVIAVILMVAITVVLAATVFVLVSDIGSKSGKGVPTFEVNEDAANDKLTVTGHSGGADWNRLEVRANKALYFALNAAADATNGTALPLNTWVRVSQTANGMEPGEYIEFCGDTTAQTDVDIDFRDGQQLVKQAIRMSSIAVC